MLTAIAAAFLDGLILNLMPCVFPVISLKALSLIRHHDKPAHARAEGLAFLLGVVVTMLALVGVLLLARAGGASVGWGFQLQSPMVIALLILVMLASALNLFGVFEIGLSLQRAGEVGGNRGGLVGSAFTGALAIVVATPCSAPFMASAVGYALTQPPAVSLVISYRAGARIRRALYPDRLLPGTGARAAGTRRLDDDAETRAGFPDAGRRWLADLGAGTPGGFGGAGGDPRLLPAAQFCRLAIWHGAETPYDGTSPLGAASDDGGFPAVAGAAADQSEKRCRA